MSLSYLEKYSDLCNLGQLRKLKQEQDLKWEQKPFKKIQQALSELPEYKAKHVDLSKNEISVGKKEEISEEDYLRVEKACKEMIPWKKGPFNLFDIEIDAEWRSDMKWERIKNSLPDLKDKKILDIGCNNGHTIFKMAEQTPALVLGIDPVVRCNAQFNLIQHFAKIPNLHFEMFGIEHLSHFHELFDIIFSMGIIYHHRNPIQQLLEIKNSLKPGGTLILETIGIPGKESTALFPEERYAKMKNVWFVPTLSCFINWTKRAKFIDVEVISDTPLTSEEQRVTKWCPPTYQSLEDFLNPHDKSLTIEGYPAPRRFAIIAKKRG